MRFATQSSTDLPSWTIADASGGNTAATHFAGAVFDGGYVYFFRTSSTGAATFER